MAETSDSEKNAIERIIDEYQGISHAIEEEKDRFEELSHVLAKSQYEAERIIAEAREQAHRIFEDTMAQAEQQAQQIINEAEERVKNEAKKQTEREVELTKKAAKDKAVKLITKARQISENTANSIIAESRQEAEKLAKQLIEKTRKGAAREAQEIRKKAHADAEQIINNARNAAREEGQKELAIMTTVAQQVAEQIIREDKEKIEIEKIQLTTSIVSSAEGLESESFSNLSEPQKIVEESSANTESQSQTELEDSTPARMEVQQSLAKVFETAINEAEKTGDESSEIPVPDTSEKEPEYLASSQIEYETSELTESENRANRYDGKLELHIIPPFDFGQLSTFENQLLQVPNMQLLGKGDSGSGMIWYEVNYSEPLLIENLLRKMSPIKEISKHGNYIMILLNDR
ncbi:MAG: hypothetical protein ACYS9T_08100 [Planctomycetota bacterium]|jgi:vacuolar-type H+-ATPase subunit H